jgi:hypothetical protein
VTDVYNAIKAQQAKFPIPQNTATYVVGTFDAALGHFTYAIPIDTTIELDRGDPRAPGGPLKPLPRPVREIIATITALNVENVTLQFNVVNRQGRDFVLSVPGYAAVHAPAGQDFVTLNVAQASVIDRFVLTCGKRFMSQGPIEIQHKLVGLGVFTLPALPLALVYAPPPDQNKKNTASWSFSNSMGINFSVGTSQKNSSQTPDPQFNTPAGLSAVIGTAGKTLGLLSDSTIKEIGGVLGVISSVIAMIPQIFGQTKVTTQISTTSSQQHVLSLTVTDAQKVVTSAANGGPGSADIIYYLVNARMCWFVNGNSLQLALLGWEGVASISVGTLRSQGVSSGLNTATIQSLLALDPFVAAGPQAALSRPRYVLIETAEVGGSQWERTETYTLDQQDTSTSESMSSTVTDMEAGWLSFLGIGPSKTETDTVSYTLTSSAQTSTKRTVTDTLDLYAGPTEIYSVEIYTDVIFGTFAYRSVPAPAAAKLAGTVHNTLNRPVPHAQVVLMNNGKRYVTRADAHGHYAFHSAGITPGETAISSGAAHIQVSFAGKPVGNLNLKATALRTA